MHYLFFNVRRKSFCNKILQNQPKVRHLQLYICMCMYVCMYINIPCNWLWVQSLHCGLAFFFWGVGRWIFMETTHSKFWQNAHGRNLISGKSNGQVPLKMVWHVIAKPKILLIKKKKKSFSAWNVVHNTFNDTQKINS